LRLKVLTMLVLQARGVFVSNKEQFMIDIEQLSLDCEQLINRASTLCKTSYSEALNSSVTAMVLSMLRQLDRIVTETAGCDSYITKFVTALDKLVAKFPESMVSLAKKFKLVAANTWLKLKDYDRATALIQSCCQLI